MKKELKEKEKIKMNFDELVKEDNNPSMIISRIERKFEKFIERNKKKTPTMKFLNE